MNDQAKPNEQPDDKPPMARLSRSVWSLFLVVMLVVLAVDLGLKAWSFEHVADTPITLRIYEAGGPEVLVPEPESGELLPSHLPSPTRDRLTGHPSVVPMHEPTVVVPSLLNFQLTLNTGAVFGTGQGGRPVFILVSVIALAVIVTLVYRGPTRPGIYQAGLALILGGALGNLYDRVRFAAVRDMLHMLPGVDLPFGLSWPGGETQAYPWIFNPADVALILGVGIVFIISWRQGSLEKKKAKQAQQDK